MSTPEAKQAVKELAARGIRAMTDDDWTYQRALDIVRENRRRQGDTPTARAVNSWSAGLVEDVQNATGVAPADIAHVLLYAASWVGGLAIVQGLGRDTSLSILSCTADELDQRAKAAEER